MAYQQLWAIFYFSGSLKPFRLPVYLVQMRETLYNARFFFPFEPLCCAHFVFFR